MQSAALAERRRDVRVIGVVGMCHFFSHFYQFVLPPLSILIHQSEGYSIESLAFLVSIFYGASFALQLPVGFFVDRFGARNILMAGVVILAACTLLYGVFTSYPALVFLTIIAGAANSVFHPADYSILNASVKSERLGRAFSVHNFAGFAGYGLAPVLVAWLGSLWGWQTASIVTGAVGLFFVFFVFALSSDFQDSSDTRRDEGRPSSLSDDLKTLMQGPLLLCLLFFALLAAGQLGAQWFADDVLHIGHGIPVIEGNSYVTIFVVGISIGIIMGGIAADRSANHIRLASIGFVACGIGTISMGLAPPEAVYLYPLFAVTGFLFGFGFASRDLLVRSLAPKGASGAVFGFVFSGLDIGSMSIPLVYGYFLGVGMEFYVFYLGGILIVLAAGMIGAAGKKAAQA
ncbi:MAG: MFS transporter [Rhodospirillaceae bacterium]|nr:MAG: MFS transporter [Rhodospirillaceae bacterium]